MNEQTDHPSPSIPAADHRRREDDDDSGSSESPRVIFTGRNRGRILDFYLVSDIGPADQYTEWFNAIRNAGPSDVVNIHINSSGGDVLTAIQFMRVLRECSALTVGSIEGACMSAATMIFLQCDAAEVSDHCSFMIHNYSGGVIGKGGEMIEQAKFEYAWSNRLYSDVYRDFLLPSEIESVLKGQDFWMTTEQVIDRLRKRQAVRDAQAKAKEKSLKGKR